MRFIAGLVFLSTLFSLSLSHGASSAPAKRKVRIVYYHYPPHFIITKTGMTGAAYEVWNRVTKRAQVDSEWIGPIPFLRAQAMLEKGEADVMVRFAKTPEREKKFIYTEKAPMWGKQGIAVLRTEPLNEIRTPEDIRGKNIGMISGGILPKFLADNRDLVTLEPIPIDTVHLNMTKLIKKRIWGVYFVFADVANYFAAKEKLSKEIKIIPYPGSQGFQYSYMPISRKADPKLAELLVKAINIESQTYDYEKISQKYIDMAAKGLIDEKLDH